jgi:hypothetical protein
MSDDRFDQLAKAAATTTSRRQVLKILGGGVFAALFSGAFASRARGAGQDCLPPNSPCKVNGDCCSTALGNSCCCHFEKKKESSPGICSDRDVCISTGGVCN